MFNGPPLTNSGFQLSGGMYVITDGKRLLLLINARLVLCFCSDQLYYGLDFPILLRKVTGNGSYLTEGHELGKTDFKLKIPYRYKPSVSP